MNPAYASPKRSTAWRVLKWLLVLGLLSCGCCGGALSLCTAALSGGSSGSSGGFHWDRSTFDAEPGKTVELGTAAYPDGTLSPARDYTWSPSTFASDHHLRYVLGSPEARALSKRFRAVANSTTNPCESLECAYEFIYRASGPALDPLAERFIERIEAAHLKTDDAANLVITFVQNIPYAIPKDQPFEVLPAPLVVSEARGDCDSKAVLGVILLRKLGIPAVLLISERLAHAAVGVGLPGPGLAFTYKGRKYRYAEVTAAGWPIGEVAPETNKPKLWRPLWIGPSEK